METKSRVMLACKRVFVFIGVWGECPEKARWSKAESSFSALRSRGTRKSRKTQPNKEVILKRIPKWAKKMPNKEVI